MPRWFVLLDGPQEDVVHVKRLFSASGFSFDQIDGKDALAAPALEWCENESDAIDASMELLASINAVLRLSVISYSGFNFYGIVELRDGAKHRTTLANRGNCGLPGVAAVGIAGFIGKSVRSKEERLLSLLGKKPEIADVANRMATRPLTWAAMTTAYESVAGLMSSKDDPGKARSDFEGLIARGWLTKDEADGFYNTAAFHRKGYPKSPVRRVLPMEYHTACILTKRLFWCLVDELEPE